jgi:REP element-mobilizing transposase RayT
MGRRDHRFFPAFSIHIIITSNERSQCFTAVSVKGWKVFVKSQA